MNKKILNEINQAKYLFDYKRGVVISEQKNLNSLIKSVLKESSKDFPCNKTFATNMSFQEDALTYYVGNGDTEILTDNPSGCTPPRRYNTYSQGEKNQCKFKSNTLCGGRECFQKEAVDGIWGPNTQKAWEELQDKLYPYNNSGETFYESYTQTCWEMNNTVTNNWQIPAGMENIKCFQYWIWKIIEKDAEVDPNNSDLHKSILCGNNFCKKEQAVDGFWGSNTKKAWDQYGQCYLKYFNIAADYTSLESTIADKADSDPESIGYNQC
jgi:hypothetical protein